MLAKRLPPAMIPVNCQFSQKFNWPATLESAWLAGHEENISGARFLYEQVEQELPNGYSLCPDLNVLRHTTGIGEGQVIPLGPTEDEVNGLFMEPRYEESEFAEGLTAFDPFDLEGGIRTFLKTFNPGYFKENIHHEQPHIFVMSTGRCGTVSLYHLFKGSHLEPYHTYWFTPSIADRLEFICRLVERNFKDDTCWRLWMESRAAEWLGKKPMLALNHTDTVFAPVFAALHPKSKFIYLKRNRHAVFWSYYSKDQYGSQNLMPVRYKIANDFRWKSVHSNDVQGIEWLINFTYDFAKTIGRIFKDRYIEIRAEKLFAQDRDEIARLLEFTNSDIDPDQAMRHFERKYNEKAHKIRA